MIISGSTNLAPKSKISKKANITFGSNYEISRAGEDKFKCLRGANLEGKNLAQANLEGVDLAYAYGTNTNLAGANLAGANLSRAVVPCATFRGADLREAKLKQADLAGANLQGVNLLGADLTETNLSGADLSGAVLSREAFSRADGKNAFTDNAIFVEQVNDLTYGDVDMLFPTEQPKRPLMQRIGRALTRPFPPERPAVTPDSLLTTEEGRAAAKEVAELSRMAQQTAYVNTTAANRVGEYFPSGINTGLPNQVLTTYENEGNGEDPVKRAELLRQRYLNGLDFR